MYPNDPRYQPPQQVHYHYHEGAPSDFALPSRITAMGTLGNVLWLLVGGGLSLAIGYFVAGLLYCVTIIGIPLGLQCFKLASLALWPFDKRLVADRTSSGCLAMVGNLIWLPVGLGLLVLHLCYAILCVVCIVTIPFAMAHLRLARVAVFPFGVKVV